ncbi:hypothetical protein FN846DRAFT_910216 [Sphaerosporella brunnea]|uniref:Uncharacterized protein n=1 Tax=Sphaerosporella brunnea TaxID=1250544 RepID=A0A5J5ENR6_9PEZI|nr:hypothetical protein FN846DRAFT_910216 [Sphaerosporella brunnea]
MGGSQQFSPLESGRPPRTPFDPCKPGQSGFERGLNRTDCDVRAVDVGWTIPIQTPHDSSEIQELSVVLEDHFPVNEVWLSNSGNDTKWSKALAERLIASKTLTDDEWFKKALELGDRLGVDTAEIGKKAAFSWCSHHRSVGSFWNCLHGEQGVCKVPVFLRSFERMEMTTAFETCIDRATLEAAASLRWVDAKIATPAQPVSEQAATTFLARPGFPPNDLFHPLSGLLSVLAPRRHGIAAQTRVDAADQAKMVVGTSTKGSREP